MFTGNRRDFRDRYNNGREEQFQSRNERPLSSYSPSGIGGYYDRPEPILEFVRGPSDRYRLPVRKSK